MMVLEPQVLVTDNDDTGSEVPTDTDHQEDARRQQGADQIRKEMENLFI